MRKILAWFVWNFKIYPKYYSESDGVDVTRVMLDIAAQKFTRGKIGFSGARPVKHQCKVCSKVFYTERKLEDTCKKWVCYKEFHCGGRK